MITITSQAIDKFLADSRRYLAAENPYFTRIAGRRAAPHPAPRQTMPAPMHWASRSSL